MTQNNKNKNKKIKIRSCIICNVEGSKNEFIRFVKSPEGYAVPDISGKLPGRGAYICPDMECIKKAEESGALLRAIGADLNKDSWPELENYVKNKDLNIKLKLRSLISMSCRARVLKIGVDNIKTERHALILTAYDCSEKIKEFANEHENNLILPFNIDELSEITGAKNVQVIGLPIKSGIAKNIKRLKF